MQKKYFFLSLFYFLNILSEKSYANVDIPVTSNASEGPNTLKSVLDYINNQQYTDPKTQYNVIFRLPSGSSNVSDRIYNLPVNRSVTFSVDPDPSFEQSINLLPSFSVENDNFASKISPDQQQIYEAELDSSNAINFTNNLSVTGLANLNIKGSFRGGQQIKIYLHEWGKTQIQYDIDDSPQLDLSDAINLSADINIYLSDRSKLAISNQTNIESPQGKSGIFIQSYENFNANPIINVLDDVIFSSNFTFSCESGSTTLFNIASSKSLYIPKITVVENIGVKGPIVIKTQSNDNQLKIASVDVNSQIINIQNSIYGNQGLKIINSGNGGMVLYNGKNMYTGRTSITSAGLVVNPSNAYATASLGSLNSSILLFTSDSYIQVNKGATVFAESITGSGKIIYNGGKVFSPQINVTQTDLLSSSIVSGDIEQPNNANFAVSADQVSPSMLSVNGAFNLPSSFAPYSSTSSGASFQLIPSKEYYDYTLFQPFVVANTISGVFENINPSSLLLDVNLQYTPT